MVECCVEGWTSQADSFNHASPGWAGYRWIGDSGGDGRLLERSKSIFTLSAEFLCGLMMQQLLAPEAKGKEKGREHLTGVTIGQLHLEETLLVVHIFQVLHGVPEQTDRGSNNTLRV
ncbi:Protein of unknown function [Gryllus bimaculatus]|nr:Protein of unknown function [Gryllus bimaculatus]